MSVQSIRSHFFPDRGMERVCGGRVDGCLVMIERVDGDSW